MPKPKLTPEEKKAKKLEQKAEKKRQAELQKQQVEFDRLFREIKHGQLTLKRHEKSWREMLLKIAVPRMKDELEFAWHNFERVIDAKDFTISLLMDELNNAEEQYMRNMRSHMDNIDNLIVLCYDQIADLRKESNQVIQNLYTAATYERTDIINLTKENEEYLRTMLYMLDDQKKESEKLLRGEYLSKQEVEISRLNEACYKFTEECEAKFDKMWKDSLAFLKNHITRCANRRREYYQLRQQDEMMQKLIKNLWARFRKNFEKIKILKLKFAEFQYEQHKKIKELTHERNHFDGVHSALKNRMESEILLDDRNLTFLTIHSNHTIKALEDFEKKGEKLLKLAAICRKYETAEEKTMPFPLFSDPDILKVNLNITTARDIDCDGYKKELTLFLNRVAQADDLRYKLNEELQYLKMENIDLKKQIYEYCQCVSCEEYQDQQ